MCLSQEEMFDRSLGGENHEHEVPHWFGNIAYVIVTLILKIAFRYSVTNRQTLRDLKGKTGVVLVSNHTSYMDVAFLWCTVRPSQWCRFMARDTLFETMHGFGGWMIAHAGAFPVKRDSADRTSVKRAAHMLKNKEVVGIFPEGTRRGKGTAKPSLHAGAALVAKMGNAPMLPCTVRNAEYIKQKGQRIHFPKVSVAFGTPLSLSDFDFVPKEDRMEACTWYVMRECFALSRECAPEDVDMTDLFPDSKDYADVFAGVKLGEAAAGEH